MLSRTLIFRNHHLHNFPLRFVLNLNNARRTSRNKSEMFDDVGSLVDEATYFKMMKEFMQETAGLPKYSQKWWEIRNRYYKKIYEISKENKIKNPETLDVCFIHFYFVLMPEVTECYELLALLNYNNLKYKAVSFHFFYFSLKIQQTEA